MAFEFGMFHEFQCPAGVEPAGGSLPRSFEQVTEAAERWVLDAMWLAEIHVAPGAARSALLPLTIASAIAARTKRT